MKNNNMVSWFEISVTDMDRAKKFYETVMGKTAVEGFGFFGFCTDTEGNTIGFFSKK